MPANINPATPTSGLSWTVTSQQETIDKGPDGNLVQGYRVNFSTPSGITGSIFVAKARYSAQAVQQQLAQHVAELEAVSRSTGT